MKITSFNPLIVIGNAQAAIALFEEMSFERRHSITVNSNGKDITCIRLKDSGGFYVDVAQVDASVYGQDGMTKSPRRNQSPGPKMMVLILIRENLRENSRGEGMKKSCIH